MVSEIRFSKKKEIMTTLALAGFYVDPLSLWIWNLEMLVFLERGKLLNHKKEPRSKAKPTADSAHI